MDPDGKTLEKLLQRATFRLTNTLMDRGMNTHTHTHTILIVLNVVCVQSLHLFCHFDFSFHPHCAFVCFAVSSFLMQLFFHLVIHEGKHGISL